ncbi:hypothetical protein OIU78_001299 [Salix suchowensis]|nr:hypothetical protein OIU78_001299 [Salix suchowensis]
MSVPFTIVLITGDFTMINRVGSTIDSSPELPTQYQIPLPKDIVLCKIYRKATSLKVLEQRATMEEEMRAIHASASSSSLDTMSFCSQLEEPVLPPVLPSQHLVFKKEIEETDIVRHEQPKEIKGSTLQLPSGEGKLPQLQVPSKWSMEWNQDPIWSLNSPWLQNLIPYADVLNF